MLYVHVFTTAKYRRPRGRKRKACMPARAAPRARRFLPADLRLPLSRKRQRKQKRGHCPPSWRPTLRCHWPNLPLTSHIELCTLSSMRYSLHASLPARSSPAKVIGPAAKGHSPDAAGSGVEIAHFTYATFPPKVQIDLRPCRRAQLASPHRLRATRNTQVDATASLPCCIGAGGELPRQHTERSEGGGSPQFRMSSILSSNGAGSIGRTSNGAFRTGRTRKGDKPNF